MRRQHGRCPECEALVVVEARKDDRGACSRTRAGPACANTRAAAPVAS